MSLACNPCRVTMKEPSGSMVTCESCVPYEDKIMVAKYVPTVEVISCDQHSGACPVSAHHLHSVLYCGAVCGLCWLLPTQESPAVPPTATLDSVLTGHAITPPQDLSKHMCWKDYQWMFLGF